VVSVSGRGGAVSADQDDYAASLIENDSTVAGDDVKAALETLAGLIPAPAPVDSVNTRTGAVAGLAEASASYLYPDLVCSAFVGGGAGSLDAVLVSTLSADKLAYVKTASGCAVYRLNVNRTTEPIPEGYIGHGTTNTVYACIKPDDATGATEHWRWELECSSTGYGAARTEQSGWTTDLRTAHTWTVGDMAYRVWANAANATTFQTVAAMQNDYGKLYFVGNYCQKTSNAVARDDLMNFNSRRSVPSPDKMYYESLTAGLPITTALHEPAPADASSAIICAKSGSVVMFEAHVPSNITAGTHAFRVYKNGSALGMNVTIPSGSNFYSTTADPGTYAFVAGDYLEIRVETDASFAPTEAWVKAKIHSVYNN